MTPSEFKNRTRVSFVVLILAFVAAIGGYEWMRTRPTVDDIPRPLRANLEMNGRLWRKLFSYDKKNIALPPKKSTRPRVNGDVGLEDALGIENWSMDIVEDDQNPKARRFTITLADIKKLPRTETAANFRCIEGWSENMSFAGVKFSDFMKAYHLAPNTFVGLRTNNGEYYVSIDMESMLHDQTLLAYEMNGEPLRMANGAPLRLVIPVKYGIKNIKRIGRIAFSSVRPPDYWEEQGYDWYADL